MTDYDTGTADERCKEINSDSPKLYAHYRQYWDIEHIADVEAETEDFNSTTSRSATQLLDVADIDTIVDTFEKQIAIQEKHIYSDEGNSLAIRICNGNPEIAEEAKRLQKSTADDTILAPGVISYAKFTDGEVAWIRLVEVEPFVEAWITKEIRPDGVYQGINGVTQAYFEPETVEASGAVLYRSGCDE